MSNEKARELRRGEIVEKLARHILQRGLPAATLRLMAEAAGTSDRMLLYYFENKDDLMGSALARIAAEFSQTLDAAIPNPLPVQKLVAELGKLIQRADVQPYMQVWLELAAHSGRGQESFQAVAGALCDGFLAWVRSRLPPRQASSAGLVLTLIEGSVLLNAMNRGTIVNSALTRFRK